MRQNYRDWSRYEDTWANVLGHVHSYRLIVMTHEGRTFTLTIIQDGNHQLSRFRVQADLKLVVLQTDSYDADN